MAADQAARQTTGKFPEIGQAISNKREYTARAKRVNLLDDVQRIAEILPIAIAGGPGKHSGEEDGVDRAKAEGNSIDRLGRRNEVSNVKLNVRERCAGCCRVGQPFGSPGQSINTSQSSGSGACHAHLEQGAAAYRFLWKPFEVFRFGNEVGLRKLSVHRVTPSS